MRRIRRPLDILNDSQSSNPGVGINIQKSLSDFQNHNLANLSLNSPQDIFYQKRALSQQSLSSINNETITQMLHGEEIKNINDSETNKEDLETTNDNIIDKNFSSKMCEKNVIKQVISPYFLNNKLTDLSKISSSGYRPSGLRRRTSITVNKFPKIL